MKRVLLFLLLLPFFSQAQKLKLNEYDKFIKLRRMETLPVTVKGDEAGKMALSFSSVGADFYLQLNGSGIGTYIIDANDKLVLQFENDSALTIPSKGYQNYDINGGEITYHHSYVLSLTDMERLSRNNLVAIRKSHADKFDDISVAKENIKIDLRKLVNPFRNILDFVYLINIYDTDFNGIKVKVSLLYDDGTKISMVASISSQGYKLED